MHVSYCMVINQSYLYQPSLVAIVQLAYHINHSLIMIITDPFVKVVVTHKGEKVYRWKSTVKKKTLSPVYNESFSYQVTQDMRTALDVNDLALNFYIIDHDRLGQNDKMGEVKVGQRVNSELGRRHWTKLLQSPWQRISFWHPIELPREAPPSPRRFARGKSPY